MQVDFGKQRFQVLAGELPLERTSGGAIVILEAQQSILQFGEGAKVVGRECLALNDGEVHLDLVEPAGMHRGMHRDDRGPASLQAFDTRLTAVRGAVIHDPEHSRGAAVGRLFHDLCDEALEGDDAGLFFAAAKDLGGSYIPSGDIGPSTAALILVFDAHLALRSRGESRVDAATSLDAGLLVGGEDAIGRTQGLAFPLTLVQIEHAAGLVLKGRIAWEDPSAMRPRTDCILTQPAPQRRLPDRGDEAPLDDLAADLRYAPARERHLRLVGELTGERFNRDDEAGGKRALGARCGTALPAPAAFLDRIACATC